MTYPPQEPLKRPIRLAAFISGGGTTVLNFLEQIKQGKLSAEIPLVVSSRRDCSGVQRMKDAGLRCEIVRPKDFSSVEAFSDAAFALCRDVEADLVTLAGFLSLIRVPEDFLNRVMNIHPALIPAFCGKGFYGHHVHEAVVARGVKLSGCTVHFSDNQYDHGPIILQRSVPVLDTDSPDDVAGRVFQEECNAYPEAIRLYAEGHLAIDGQRVRIRQV
ncbi:MAG: phosphoribosylglycinamide formyltransferase [Planctomycetaceae bacterium]|nr:phosphoribosylglycinamide formyltransferase [Planctomycetaceae bacterium]